MHDIQVSKLFDLQIGQEVVVLTSGEGRIEIPFQELDILVSALQSARKDIGDHGLLHQDDDKLAAWRKATEPK